MVVYKYNSADNHLDQRWIPANLWHDRVAAKFKDRAPRVVEDEGRLFWTWEGRIIKGREGGTADGPDDTTVMPVLTIFRPSSGIANDTRCPRPISSDAM